MSKAVRRSMSSIAICSLFFIESLPKEVRGQALKFRNDAIFKQYIARNRVKGCT